MASAGERRAGAGGAPRGSNRWFCMVSGRVRCGERCGRPSSRSSAVPATQWLERMAGHSLPVRGVGDTNAGAGHSGSPGQTRQPLTAIARAAPGRALRPSSPRPRGSPGSWPHLLASRASGQRGGRGRARIIIMQGARSKGSNSSHLLIPESCVETGFCSLLFSALM